MSESYDHTGSPVTHGRARVNGVRLHYVTAGSGQPLLLIHGTPKSHFYWHRVVPLLTQHFTVVAPDVRGFGDSDKPMASLGYDSATVATDLTELMDSLGHQTFAVHGEDRGAEYAYAVAASARDRVSHLSFGEMMLSGLGLEELSYFTEENLAARWERRGTWKWHNPFFFLPDVPEMLIAGREREFWGWWMRAEMWNPAALSTEELDEWIGHLSSPGGLRGVMETYRAVFVNARLNRDWSTRPLSMPVLATGAREFYGHHVAEQMHKVATRVQEQVWEDSGHSLALEQPERLAATLTNFLSG